MPRVWTYSSCSELVRREAPTVPHPNDHLPLFSNPSRLSALPEDASAEQTVQQEIERCKRFIGWANPALWATDQEYWQSERIRDEQIHGGIGRPALAQVPSHIEARFPAWLRSEAEIARRELEKAQQAHFALVAKRAPIAHVMDDILLEIFASGGEPAHWLAWGRYSTSKRHGSRGRFPMLVTHVCQRWRRLALQTPSLWTHLATDDFDFRLTAVDEEMIKRCGILPLQLRVERGQNSRFLAAGYQRMATCLGDRLASISISLPLESIEELCAALSGHTEELNEVELSVRCSDDSAGQTTLRTQENTVPYLNSAPLHTATLEHTITLAQRALPLEKLKSLSVKCTQGNESLCLATTIAQCTSLRRLCLIGNGLNVNDTGMAASIKITTLPHLEVLDLTDELSLCRFLWLGRFRFPSLTHLTLGMNYVMTGGFDPEGRLRHDIERRTFLQGLDRLSTLRLIWRSNECTDLMDKYEVDYLVQVISILQEGVLPAFQHLSLVKELKRRSLPRYNRTCAWAHAISNGLSAMLVARAAAGCPLSSLFVDPPLAYAHEHGINYATDPHSWVPVPSTPDPADEIDLEDEKYEMLVFVPRGYKSGLRIRYRGDKPPPYVSLFVDPAKLKKRRGISL